ncbi:MULTISPECIES: hypothetical protein [unclassified Mesorhizobium]|uniref:hypothetical protein n=1 Tax=unclassified Mesorhizobium TaxID=325217 RepID=UPI00333AE600
MAVHEPFDPSALAHAIEQAIRDEGLDQVCPLNVSEDRGTLAQRLRESFGANASTPEGFALDINYAVILAWGAEEDSAFRADLQRFARAAAGRRVASSPAVLFLSRRIDPACDAPIWQMRTTQGVLGPLDGATFAAQGSSKADTLSARLAIAVAVEVGAWDLDVIERIQSARIASAIRPDLDVKQWADERLDRWSKTNRPDWPSGSYDLWGGENCVHPLFLAANQPHLLKKRVWRGQVAVLFPWLEERRQDVIRCYRSRLRADPNSYYEDVETLDWGPICRQLGGQPLSVRDYLHGARRLRNNLAHGVPAEWSEVEACLRAEHQWRATAGRLA